MQRLGADVKDGIDAATMTVLSDMATAIDPNIPTITSNLRRNKDKRVNRTADGAEGELVYTQDYGRFVNDGTGIFGQYKTPIVPKNKKALKTPYGLRKSVKGMEGRHFVEKGLSGFSPEASFEKGLQNYLTKKGW